MKLSRKSLQNLILKELKSLKENKVKDYHTDQLDVDELIRMRVEKENKDPRVDRVLEILASMLEKIVKEEKT